MKQSVKTRKKIQSLIKSHIKNFKAMNLKFSMLSFVLSIIPMNSVVESKENTQVKKICLLCDNGKKIKENHKKIYSEITNETNILFESQNFYIAIDNYPVCDDHILIVPKKHEFSYSVIEIELQYEFEAIIETLSEIIGTKNYGLFEHGSNMVNNEQKGCGNSIYHAHMHFIPNLNMKQQNIIDLCIVGKKHETISLKKNYELTDFCTEKAHEQTMLSYIKSLPTTKPYLFCYYSNKKQASLCIPDDKIDGGVASQFFRRVFAEYFQESDVFWNWKKEDEIQKSIERRNKIIKETIKKFQNKKDITKTLKSHLKSYKKKHSNKCVFCDLKNKKKIIDGDLIFVLEDDSPVTKHHSLIIPKRHFSSFFDITNDELLEINKLLKVQKNLILEKDPSVEGFNVGINIESAAGQSVFHLHVHLIPRRHGDIKNPKGGVRGVIPNKRNY